MRNLADVQLIDLPEIEFLDGKAYPKVSPKLSHALVQGALCGILRRLAGKRGRVAPELDVWPSGIRGSGTKFVPDIAYLSMVRLRSLTLEQREEPPFSPDIAIEVWSPSNERWYLEEKIARYLATGSLLVLDVDPGTRTIVAHDSTSVRCYACGETFEHPTFDWLRFDVTEVFAELDDD